MLSDKVIIIIGGLGLVGKSFSKVVSENKARLIVADFNENNDLVKDQLPNAFFCKVDISSKDSLECLIELVIKKYGKIDAVVNSSYPKNKNYGRSFFDVKYEDFNENLSIHLGGFFLCSQVFSKLFINQGFGNIINISSVYGVIAPKFDIYDETDFTMPVEYAAIKSALNHLTKYIAKNLKNTNVRINNICLGGVFDNHSIQFANNYKKYCLNKGLLDPSDFNGTLIFLLSDNSAMINGQNIIVDDGFTL